MILERKKSKSALFMMLLLVAGTNTAQIRNLGEKVAKDPNCNEYDDDGSCCKCSYRFYPDPKTKLCTRVSDFCETWSEKNGDCLTCYPSFGSPVNGKCNATPSHGNGTKSGTSSTYSGVCDQNCQTYDDDRVCKKCYSGFKLDSKNRCVKIISPPTPPIEDHCCKYVFVDSKGKHHEKQFSGREKVCIQCDEGYYLNKESKCIKLPKNCEAADQNGKCTDCFDGNKVNTKGSCQQIPKPKDDHCAEYKWIDVKGKEYHKWFSGCKQVCKKCDEGYELNDKWECVEIEIPEEDDHCAEYKYIDHKGKQWGEYVTGCKIVCKKCEEGYKFNDEGECEEIVVPEEDDHCAEYKYIDHKGKQWRKWVSGCKVICKKCDEGYELNQKGECQQIVVPQEDDHCAEYKHIDAKGKQHSKWVYGCRTICKKCQQGYELNDKDECSQIVIPQDDHCSEYKYVDIKGKQYKKLFHNCKIVCKKCDEGYELNDQGVCEQIIEEDHCAEYKYVDGKGKEYEKWFQACKVICKRCEEGYYLNKDNSCVELPDNCKAADVSGKCTECDTGYKVNSKGQCEKVVVPPIDNCAEYGYIDAKGKFYPKFVLGCKKVCIKCKQGLYLDKTNSCVTLPKYCTSADASGKCTSCVDKYEVNEKGECEKCKQVEPQKPTKPTKPSKPQKPQKPENHCAQYSFFDKKGKKYNNWFKECVEVCVKCREGYQLEDGKCVPCDGCEDKPVNPFCNQWNQHGECCGCAPRTFLNHEGICQPVSDYCETWNEKTGECTCCYTGYKLCDGECVLNQSK